MANDNKPKTSDSTAETGPAKRNHFRSFSVMLHVGMIRTGSTFLQKKWLAKNPYLLSGSLRLETIQLCRLARDDMAPQAQGLVISDERLTAPSSPDTFIGFELDTELDVQRYQRKACQLLHSIFPSATVLLVTRGFDSMLRSVYSLYTVSGGCLWFPEFLAKYETLLLQLLDYNYLTSIYTEHFGTNNVLVLPYEMLRDQPDAFFTHIERALDIPKHRVENESVNAGPGAAALCLYPRLSQLVASIANRIGSERGEKLARLYYRILRSGRLDSLVRTATPVLRRLPCPQIKVEPSFLAKFRELGVNLSGIPEYFNYSAEYVHQPGD